MPELPEVECTRRRIAPDVEGRRILEFASLWPRKVFPSEGELSRRVQGQKIRPLQRHGKRLILPLSDGSAVTVHLGMSGNLEFHRHPPREQRHLRAMFSLSRGKLLFFDARKFGRIEWHPSLEAARAGLGPDALDPALTASAFGSALAKTRRPVKSALLDQSLVAGVGNIYSDEALFHARIHPLAPASSLTPARLARLFRAVRAVLRASVCRQGTSIDWVWPGGRMQHHLLVYGRTGEPCARCGAAIRHLVIGQRSCHFCARCQPPRTPRTPQGHRRRTSG
ncbi:MAG: bifunctional DNA-formamidopyrimidine glycosylase/DNA-(apurinic or apyrimidinic site) lyase [Myxococcales bacterium]|nr:bifunctional DNA-formamidopyrimidine glycosylase/DNA-(apurinic or apyrimidinic site) lyase [Myxococcales bacterium]